MKITIISFAILLSSIICFGSKTSNIDLKSPSANYSLNKTGNGDTLELVGNIIKVSLRSKKDSKEIAGEYDYYFKTAKHKYFIKINEGVLSAADLEYRLKMEVRLKFIVKTGEWDSDPNSKDKVQSRTGEYIVILQELRRD